MSLNLCLPERCYVNLSAPDSVSRWSCPCMSVPNKGFALSFTELHRNHHMGDEEGYFTEIVKSSKSDSHWLQLTQVDPNNKQYCKYHFLSSHTQMLHSIFMVDIHLIGPLPAYFLVPANDFHKTCTTHLHYWWVRGSYIIRLQLFISLGYFFYLSFIENIFRNYVV